MIAKGDVITRVAEEGSLRRCGGQGDVVAGVMGVMNLWSTRTATSMPSGVVAATATSQIVRIAASRAFAMERRGMTAMSIISELPDVIDTFSGICYKHMRIESLDV